MPISRSSAAFLTVIIGQIQSERRDARSARCDWSTYTDQYFGMLEQLKARVITHVVFDDIIGDPHRAWNEKVCAHNTGSHR
jgi:hypothetical protein